MNHYYTSTSNTDDVASATWPNPGAMGDYPQYPNFSVPQSTYPDLVSGPGYTSLAPTTEMGAFANLSTQTDITNQVSSQCVGMSTWTYPAVPQNIPDLWSMPGPCMSLSCIYRYSSYSPDANPKPTSMRLPRSHNRNSLGSRIGPGLILLPTTRQRQHLT